MVSSQMLLSELHRLAYRLQDVDPKASPPLRLSLLPHFHTSPVRQMERKTDEWSKGRKDNNCYYFSLLFSLQS